MANIVLYNGSLITLLSPSSLQYLSLNVPPNYAQYLFQMDNIKYYRIGKFYDDIQHKNTTNLGKQILYELKSANVNNSKISTFKELLNELLLQHYSIELFICKQKNNKFTRACVMTKTSEKSNGYVSFFISILPEFKSKLPEILKKLDPNNNSIDLFFNNIQFELLYFDQQIETNTIDLQCIHPGVSHELDNNLLGDEEAIIYNSVETLLNAYFN